MWIKFESGRPFVIKVYAGGINAISGEPGIENMETLARRKKLLEEGRPIQDYVVVGSKQCSQWLDGAATNNGRVMQFVATPLGRGYSVEAQMTCQTSVSDLQFEVMPTKRKGFCLTVKAVINGIDFLLEVEPSDTIESVKLRAYEFFGLPVTRFELRWGDQFLDEPGKWVEKLKHNRCQHAKEL